MPRFSVVIPLYNKENYIANTISSVLDQVLPDFEIIIIDDCSTDGSLQVAASFTDSRIQIIKHLKNKGLSASRNTGIKNAAGAYISFLDADDTWKKDYLSQMDFLIQTYPEASLFASTYAVQLSNKKIVQYPFQFNFEKHGIITNFFKENLHQSFYYPSCLTVKKEVFQEVGYYNEDITFSEDVDFNIRAHANFNMAFINLPCVVYLQDSENQITQNGLANKTIPDYDFYEKQYNNREDIKAYLDFQRYVKAKMYYISGDQTTYKALRSKIDPKNLSWKQRLLLQLPPWCIRIITQTKLWLLNNGIIVTSYK